ncbi:UDP-N-acetylenolpyruvoylglucosamine reductase [Macleaya cordata]|uniref:UDP-N-acetylmuramate dehydrogenase n=1 Tax=Macleaya cordata TaxID=56857 RepID=A0A200Q3E8_MACCD|nr:UDP-N-acetylenolpyruvoylglucosamine reductase [Macleaya cordata]
MVLHLNKQSSELFIRIPIPFTNKSKNHQKTTHHQIQISRRRKPPHISSVSHDHHHLSKPLQQSTTITTTTKNCIPKQEEEEMEEDIKSGLKFVRGKKLLSQLSTWGIGGPCNYFVQVSDQTQLLSAIRYCGEHSIRFLIIGKGSNCLFDDLGFDGCVILNRIEFIERIEPGMYRMGSGYPLNRLAVRCSSEGFTGLEFAAGVPGTVGGGAYMNAGANGQEISDAIYSVEIVRTDGRHETLNRNDLTFGYRTSSFQAMEDLAAIVAVTFQLKPSESARERQQAYLTRRKLSQPLVERSAGSVFQNPSGVGFSAGELIEKAGLKGFRVGGAMVSEIHANFLINCGGSTSRDMLQLINLVRDKINQKFGIQLKQEIRYVHPYNGFDPNRNDLPTL